LKGPDIDSINFEGEIEKCPSVRGTIPAEVRVRPTPKNNPGKKKGK
jgi:hypothetical protein